MHPRTQAGQASNVTNIALGNPVLIKLPPTTRQSGVPELDVHQYSTMAIVILSFCCTKSVSIELNQSEYTPRPSVVWRADRSVYIQYFEIIQQNAIPSRTQETPEGGGSGGDSDAGMVSR